MVVRHLIATTASLFLLGGQAFSLNVPSYSRVESCKTRTWRPVTTAAASTAAHTAAAAGSKRTSTKEAELSRRSRHRLIAAPAASEASEQQAVSLDDRHQWRASSRGGSLAAAGLVALSLFASGADPAAADPGMPGSGLGCSTSTNPSYSMVSCERTGLDRDGRLLGCSSSENCVSTSAVKVPGKLGSPWEYARQTGDADRAFASLVRAVESASDATMKTVDTKGHYLLAQFPSKVPPGSVDSVEFLVKPADQIVLYRSVSRDTLFLYPLQQPVSDQGKLKERLEGIRKELGWDMYTYQGQ
ncbi:unnamed protein product [Laminaria digitata]